MTGREQLTENYKDALFALLMEKAAEKQGESLLEENERLRSDDKSAPSPALDGRINDAITRACRREKTVKARDYAYRVVKIVAVAALIAALLLSMAFLASRSGNDTSLEFVNSTLDDHTAEVNIIKKSADTPSENGFLGIKAGWIPEGYKLVDSQEREDCVNYIYKDVDGNSITVQSYLVFHSLSFFVDTDKTELCSVKINGSDGRMMTGDNVNVMFQLGQNERLVSVYNDGGNVTEEEIIKIAENLSLI